MTAGKESGVWERDTLCAFGGLVRDAQCLARDLSVLVTSIGIHDDFDAPSFHSDVDALTGTLALGSEALAIRDVMTDDDRRSLRGMKPVYTMLAHRFFLDFQSDGEDARAALGMAGDVLGQCRGVMSRLFAALGESNGD